eukprot:365898-Chlamydomonas_euryale.AAC.9
MAAPLLFPFLLVLVTSLSNSFRPDLGHTRAEYCWPASACMQWLSCPNGTWLAHLEAHAHRCTLMRCMGSPTIGCMLGTRAVSCMLSWGMAGAPQNARAGGHAQEQRQKAGLIERCPTARLAPVGSRRVVHQRPRQRGHTLGAPLRALRVGSAGDCRFRCRRSAAPGSAAFSSPLRRRHRSDSAASAGAGYPGCARLQLRQQQSARPRLDAPLLH